MYTPLPHQPPQGVHPDIQRYGPQAPREVVDGFFESLTLQTAVLLRLAMPWGILPDYEGRGGSVLESLAGALPLAVPRGGGDAIVAALTKTLTARGGQYRTASAVRRIVVETTADGPQATGVELGDRTRLTARAVVGCGGPLPTLLDLVGEAALGADGVAAVRGYELDEFALFAVRLTLARAPAYAGGGADDALLVNLGVETPDALDALWAEIRGGTLPVPRGLYATVPTRFTATDGDVGRHVAVLLRNRLWIGVAYEASGGNGRSGPHCLADTRPIPSPPCSRCG
jgi:phytoene dehydrogenase-like protein